MSTRNTPSIPSTQALAAALYQHYERYKEQALKHRRFKHHHLVPLLDSQDLHPFFEVKVAGQSAEGRDIYLLKAGTGKTKVMLWSQMHGDEPTATMALFDLMNFLCQSDELDWARETILQNTTLYLVPMLNPDGAERYSRRNALGIDLNRDALRLQSPESVLLKQLRDELEPAFGFNLHDQSRYYTAGHTSHPATVSFLAPAYDHARSLNEVRERAMRTIAGMHEVLQQFIPGQVAKFSDEHEPRAFGDNIQKWGTSVILVESGGQHADPEKQHIRQLNFTAILAGLYLIGTEQYIAFDLNQYDQIPENRQNLFDLLIRQARYSEHGRTSLLDIGVNRQEVMAPNALGFYHQSAVEEIGDMHVFHGYEELDATGLTLEPGKVYETPFDTLEELPATIAEELLCQGYTTVRLRTLPHSIPDATALPLNVAGINSPVEHGLALDQPANFVLRDAAGTIRYAILNGFVYDLQHKRPALLHGLKH